MSIGVFLRFFAVFGIEVESEKVGIWGRFSGVVGMFWKTFIEYSYELYSRDDCVHTI